MVGTVHKSYHIGAACVCRLREAGPGSEMLFWGLWGRACPESLSPTLASGPFWASVFLFAFLVDSAHHVWTVCSVGPRSRALGQQELAWLSMEPSFSRPLSPAWSFCGD